MRVISHIRVPCDIFLQKALYVHHALVKLGVHSLPNSISSSIGSSLCIRLLSLFKIHRVSMLDYLLCMFLERLWWTQFHQKQPHFIDLYLIHWLLPSQHFTENPYGDSIIRQQVFPYLLRFLDSLYVVHLNLRVWQFLPFLTHITFNNFENFSQFAFSVWLKNFKFRCTFPFKHVTRMPIKRKIESLQNRVQIFSESCVIRAFSKYKHFIL